MVWQLIDRFQFLFEKYPPGLVVTVDLMRINIFVYEQWVDKPLPGVTEINLLLNLRGPDSI